MSNNKTSLPAEVELSLKRVAKLSKNDSLSDLYGLGYKEGIDLMAKEYHESRDLLAEVFQKHESGLLPDRFVYDKIKKFLYGE
jgi:hypothetical protein